MRDLAVTDGETSMVAKCWVSEVQKIAGIGVVVRYVPPHWIAAREPS